jgi:hypothetical protein
MKRLARALRPLGVPALLALILTTWPVSLPLIWLLLLAWVARVCFGPDRRRP